MFSITSGTFPDFDIEVADFDIEITDFDIRMAISKPPNFDIEALYFYLDIGPNNRL
jgi:hypothetical protein